MESHGDKNNLSKPESWIEVNFIWVNLAPQSISRKVEADIAFTHSRRSVHLVNTFQECPFHVPQFDDREDPFVRSEPASTG